MGTTTVAHWIRLCLQSCDPRLVSHAHHLWCFLIWYIAEIGIGLSRGLHFQKPIRATFSQQHFPHCRAWKRKVSFVDIVEIQNWIKIATCWHGQFACYRKHFKFLKITSAPLYLHTKMFVVNEILFFSVNKFPIYKVMLEWVETE